MSSYCKLGDKPKITYQFNGEAIIVYETNIAPIEVTTGSSSPNTSANYNPDGYQITFASPQAQYGTITLTVVDYQVTYLDRGPFNSDTAYYLKAIPCGESSFPSDVNGIPGVKMTTPNVTIDNSVKCPVVNINENICNIKILNNGSVIFQAQGKCPVNYSVVCGEECPPGYCKIDCEAYPGYCCINEATIQSLSNQLNS